RGAFPHVIARERSDRSNLSYSGFSLIELMVAVAVLALAILGIFQAYSVGFMGMADARNRTVATNYAQEAMEYIKNMDFGKIETQPHSTVTINGIIYERLVDVPPQEIPNIKTVITTVTWKNRKNGKPEILETDMLVYFIETTAGDPTKIMLIANPSNILTEDYDDTNGVYENRSIITAVIKDAKGNTVTTYSGEVTFLIDVPNSSGSGIFSTSSVSTNKGIATTTFTASGKGEVIITASANGLADDSVTIKITDPGEAVKINLTTDTNKLFMTPGSECTIIATIVDAGGKTVTGANNEITFSVYSGPGTLSDQQPLTDGVVEINLTSSDSTPGTITVIARATELESGFINIITGGKIYLSASSINVPVNEKSEITVTTKDVNGVPINYINYLGTTIKLNIVGTSTGTGALSPDTVTFDGSTSSMVVTFTGTSEGIVNINAEDQQGILTSADPITLTITTALIPDHIQVSASPANIKADSTETSTITARIKTLEGVTVTSYVDPITFKTITGSFSSNDPSLKEVTLSNGDVNYNDGVATVILYPPDIANTTTITVCSPSDVNCSITGSIEVGFYVEADHIKLAAEPQNISVGGKTCIVTATIYDGEIPVSGYTGSILFEIIDGHPKTLKFSTTSKSSVIKSVMGGEAEIGFTSQSNAGTAKLKVTSSFIDQYGNLKEIVGYLNIPVGITLDLVLDSVIYSSENVVSFDIDIQGAELLLEEMQVSWDASSETLNIIKIRSPYTADPAVKVFDGSTNPVSSGELIDIIDSTLSTGISNVTMYFSADMSGKDILDATFNPNSGDYTVNLIP
ncbi:MAG: prepilin-type N-terminal cleavage/methylation domain-containing protein, partial [Actinobacteria bacterium]|nr:prepilin-type N-terminal cleavage/methylation domain-containing protein [Actinomycetota bacterium]